MNQRKNWLWGHYQYKYLSLIICSILVPKKWRNRVDQYCVAQNQNKELSKWDLELENYINYNKNVGQLISNIMILIKELICACNEKSCLFAYLKRNNF